MIKLGHCDFKKKVIYRERGKRYKKKKSISRNKKYKNNSHVTQGGKKLD